MTDKEKEKLYRDYYGKVYGYILSKINHQHDAEDLASEVFVKIFVKLDTFDQSKASLSTWIYTVTRNTLTDYFRTRRVFAELSGDIEDEVTPEDEIINAEMLDTLADALGALDERERDILILRFYSGKTLKEIAASMSISYAYVKVLQNKALAELKKRFENQ